MSKKTPQVRSQVPEGYMIVVASHPKITTDLCVLLRYRGMLQVWALMLRYYKSAAASG